MFEHQANGFLLRHQSLDDLPISSLGDYEEYDHVDDMNDSGVPDHTVQLSDASQPSGSNAEDIPILLPLTLGREWCGHHGLVSLARNEAKLRHAQANDSLHRVRLALGFKSALFRTHVRNAKTQQTKTRAWTAIHSIDTSVHQHARNYSMARDAYLKVQDESIELEDLPQLRLEDLRVNTTILGATQVGQRNKQLPWLWHFGMNRTRSGTWTDECKQSFMWEPITMADIFNS